MPVFHDLCDFCLEEHRGACAHPACPIAYTGGLEAPSGQPRPAPSPTRPSVAGGDPARAVRPRPQHQRRAPRQIATQPSIVDGGEP